MTDVGFPQASTIRIPSAPLTVSHTPSAHITENEQSPSTETNRTDGGGNRQLDLGAERLRSANLVYIRPDRIQLASIPTRPSFRSGGRVEVQAALTWPLIALSWISLPVHLYVRCQPTRPLHPPPSPPSTLHLNLCNAARCCQHVFFDKTSSSPFSILFLFLLFPLALIPYPFVSGLLFSFILPVTSSPSPVHRRSFIFPK